MTKLSPFEKVLKKIAEDTLKMPDSMVAVMTILTKREAQEFLDKLAKKEKND